MNKPLAVLTMCLVSGIATAVRALKPGMQVIGVQTSRFPAMVNAIKGTAHAQGASTIAEGIAVGQPGRITPELIRERGGDLVLATTDSQRDELASFIDGLSHEMAVERLTA